MLEVKERRRWREVKEMSEVVVVKPETELKELKDVRIHLDGDVQERYNAPCE